MHTSHTTIKTPRHLLLISAVLMLVMLHANELWTHEARWAAVCMSMLYRGDILHPFIFTTPYYDKPLLSYWATLPLSYLVGQVNEWALRLPSALAGIFSVAMTYRIGTQLSSKQAGLWAASMLTTCFFFLTWTRTASADMLNIAGILFAIYWYFRHKEQPSWYSYFVFFLTLSLTSLCKGLLGAAIPALVILPDLCVQNNWKKHLRLRLLYALIPAIIIYLTPFLLSSIDPHGTQGLYKVFRENILRFFQPFDHEGGVWTYFKALPLYLLPWTFFFIPALLSRLKNWRTLSWNERWTVWATGLIFLFFTASGSRRGYYILPIIPFALLLTAQWLAQIKTTSTWRSVAHWSIAVLVILNFIWFGIVQPMDNQRDRGIWAFRDRTHRIATRHGAWAQWHINNTSLSRSVVFYLQPASMPHPADFKTVDNNPLHFKQHHPKTILIGMQSELKKTHLPGYTTVIENADQWMDTAHSPQAIAFIPIIK